MTFVGIDVGSTYTKYCFISKDDLVFESEKTPIQQKAYFISKIKEIYKRYPNAKFVSCGYGKKNIEGLENISELSALALGVYNSNHSNCAVLDIGGQDTKFIYQENGYLKQFALNDKCAAGSGIFLSSTLSLLGVDFKDVNLKFSGEPKVKLSSTCAIFAQSEIVKLIAENYDPILIIEAVVWQILQQAKKLITKFNHKELVLSGGLGEIPGINSFAEKALNCRVASNDNAKFLSAYGCAIYAKEKVL